MEEWKINRQVYNVVMAGRHTDLLSPEQVVIEDRVSIPAMMQYIYTKDMVFQQPTKSRLVAVIYAMELEKHYGGKFFDYLSDKELLTDDPYFVPFFEDHHGYNEIIGALHDMRDWENISSGWLIRTRQYFWLECTSEGVDFASTASEEELQAFFDSNKPSKTS